MLTKEASVYLLISMIFNQSYKSESAFEVPNKLLRRLNKIQFDLLQLETEGYDAIYNAIALKPCLHRFPTTMALNTYKFIIKLNSEFGSEPRNIWRNRNDKEIIQELMKFSGIGYHKAVQCIIYLNYLGEISSVSEEYHEYMMRKCEGFYRNIETDLSKVTQLCNIYDV